MSQPDLKNRWVIRPGELHIFFAAIRVIGSFIDGTGITDLWSVLYSDSTINQILKGKNFRRAVEAHTRTLITIQTFYLEAFFLKHENLRKDIFQKW